MKTVQEVLAYIQATLNAPKSKTNTFGKYNYRTAEGILSAAKNIAPEGTIITCSDTPVEVAGKLILCTTASISFGGETISVDGFALHDTTRKGMDSAQISGATASYAHKYALGGLLAIDDGERDPDSKNAPDHKEEAIHAISGAADKNSLRTVWEANAPLHRDHDFVAAKDKRKSELEAAPPGDD